MSKNKNLLNTVDTACEERQMLAGASANDPNISSTFPAGRTAAIAAAGGTVRITVSNRRVFAVVPTQDSRITNDNLRNRRDTRVINRGGSLNALAESIAMSPRSDGGRTVTRREADRIANQVARDTAAAIGGVVYVGELGGRRLNRVGSGNLPSVRPNSSDSKSILNLGFTQNRFGSAANAGELPQTLRLPGSVVESIQTINRRSVRDQIELGTLLTPGGEIEEESGFNTGDATVDSVPTVESLRRPGPVSRIGLQTFPAVRSNANFVSIEELFT
jgi:antitoxin (DNA-binding transcriptional repressor) of toxin-antitoxin stability system